MSARFGCWGLESAFNGLYFFFVFFSHLSPPCSSINYSSARSNPTVTASDISCKHKLKLHCLFVFFAIIHQSSPHQFLPALNIFSGSLPPRAPPLPLLLPPGPVFLFIILAFRILFSLTFLNPTNPAPSLAPFTAPSPASPAFPAVGIK